MNRRQFLQLSGAAAGGMLSSCNMNPEKLIPLLVPAENNSVPGVFDYYATTCRSCPAGCGIIVRTHEGRANKIEGNPLHPVNKGKACARGQAALQALYHPDRIKGPLKRTGQRGSKEFSPVSWDEGLSTLGQKLERTMRSSSKKMVFFTPELAGITGRITTAFTELFKGRHVALESQCMEAHRQASLETYGIYEMPDYDLEHSQYIISFGADFLETFDSPVRYGVAFGKMRRERATVRGLFSYAGPRMSMTAASADSWLPVKTGTEGTLALAMARVIIEEKLYSSSALEQSGMSSETIREASGSYTLSRAAKETGLTEQEIASTALDFARLKPSVAMAGDSVAGQTNGLDSLKAIHLLNLIAGNINKPGGVFYSGKPLERTEMKYSSLAESIKGMKDGTTELALFYSVDPLYSVPAKTGFQQSLEKVPFIVSFAPFFNDTALQADLILPDHTDLESWGEVIPSLGGDRGVKGIIQPVVRPVHETRPFPEVMLSLAKRSGKAVPDMLAFENYPQAIKESLRESTGKTGKDFKEVWFETLQKGGVLEEQQSGVNQVKAEKNNINVPPESVFSGDRYKYLFHLHVYPSLLLNDGRSAHLPWLQETPDPVTTAVWGTWVEINPRAADYLGIGHGDLVEVTSPVGSIQVPAVIYPAIRPEVAAIPLGQGHKDYGRYAAARGANPLDLVDNVVDKANMLPAWGATRVSIKRISRDGGLITSGHQEGSYRGELLEI